MMNLTKTCINFLIIAFMVKVLKIQEKKINVKLLNDKKKHR